MQESILYYASIHMHKFVLNCVHVFDEKAYTYASTVIEIERIFYSHGQH